MTTAPTTLEHLERLVARWKPRLALDVWTITLRVHDGDFEDGYLEIARHEHHHRAVIDVKPWVVGEQPVPDWVKEDVHDAGFIEKSVVHELLHCHFRDLRDAVADVSTTRLSQDQHDALRATLNRHEEQTVDDLSVALVNHWPSW